MEPHDPVADGRRSFDASAWPDAHGQFSAADREASLEPADLERLAVAAQLTGDDGASESAYVRAHHEWARRGEPARAAVALAGGEPFRVSVASF